MSDTLAIDGSTPVRDTMLPYSHQIIDDADIAEVTRVLKSDFLTTGPEIEKFEEAFAAQVGTKEAVAVSNGTTALHAAVNAIGIGPGDEVIVPTMTFAATANVVLMQGGTPVFVDSDPDTLLIDPQDIEKKLTDKTKAIMPVDYTGQPCDYNELRALCDKHNLKMIADACHALGAEYDGKPVGSLADLSTFSFHPVKPIATGEGGMITTDDATLSEHMRQFRNHGISKNAEEREKLDTWEYEIHELANNYRLTDIQSALGRSQLKHISEWTAHRQAIAKKYDEAFASVNGVTPLTKKDGRTHAYHLYVIQVDADRSDVFHALRAENIGVNVHYIPVHMHPLYKGANANCPVAEAAYARMISLPLFAGMSDQDVSDVIEATSKVCTQF